MRKVNCIRLIAIGLATFLYFFCLCGFASSAPSHYNPKFLLNGVAQISFNTNDRQAVLQPINIDDVCLTKDPPIVHNKVVACLKSNNLYTPKNCLHNGKNGKCRVLYTATRPNKEQGRVQFDIYDAKYPQFKCHLDLTIRSTADSSASAISVVSPASKTTICGSNGPFTASLSYSYGGFAPNEEVFLNFSFT